MVTITTISDLVNVLTTAKNGGQIATVIAETPVTLRKNPTDGAWWLGRIDDAFTPTSIYRIGYNFGESYERMMEKALGEEYVRKGMSYPQNVLIPNLLAYNPTTGNYVLKFLVNDREFYGYRLNGRPLTEDEMAYMQHYKPIKKDQPIGKPTRTICVQNVRELHFGNEVYKIEISAEELKKVI